ncbi:MAG TPA: hypothetical protein PLZ95_04400 [Bryobacteraceae bacterium]|nr:hypothetical protein [Bryobacteraceae bacterium]
MTSRTLASFFIVGMLGVAQEPKLPTEGLVRSTMVKFGLSDLKTPYQAMGQTEIGSLRPLLLSLETTFGIQPIGKHEKEPLRQYDGTFITTLREDDYQRTFNGGDVHINLTDTIQGAPRGGAIYINRVSVPMAKGSFSGVTVGDWTANLVGGPSVSLLFIRKNAVVSVRCDPTVELTKSDMSLRAIPDPGVKGRCEDLARDIDAQLLKLPGIEKEVK